MVQDVIENPPKTWNIKIGSIKLLGEPYQEGMERRLPKNMILPDSISYGNDENIKPENSDKTIDAINNFHELHSEPVMIIRYPGGWSTIDLNFLIIKLIIKTR